MASPNSTYTELVTRVHANFMKKKDNVTNHNALLTRLKEKGRKVTLDGGREIVEPIFYQENGTYQRYSGFDTLNISTSDELTAANYAWKQAAVHVVASGAEVLQHRGKEMMIPLLTSRYEFAIKSFQNNLSADVYSAGSLSNQINGLQAIISDTGAGTVGGINSSTYTWWKSVLQSNAAPIQGGSAVTISSTTIQTQMRNLWLELTRGNDAPDLIVSSNDYFDMYEASLEENRRYTANQNSGMAGFTSLKFKTADMVHDGGSLGGGVPDAHMYFINTDYLKFVVMKDADMTQLEDKASANQHAIVVPFIFMGNLTCSGRKFQGALKA